MPEFYRLDMPKEEINKTLLTAVLEAQPVVAGNFAALTKDGQIVDSQKSAADFAPAPLDKILTLYVNATTGSDSNDGLDAGHAKRTLTAALSLLPKDLGGKSVTINLSGTFDDVMNIQDFCHGDLTLQGEEGAHAVFTNAAILYSNDVLLTLNDIDLSGSYSSHVAVIRDNKSVMIDNSVMDAAAGGNGPMMRRNGYVLIRDCTINNASRTALLANSGIVSIINLSGSNNGIGILAGNSFYKENGIAIASNITIAATAKFSIQQGGVLFHDGILYGGT